MTLYKKPYKLKRPALFALSISGMLIASALQAAPVNPTAASTINTASYSSAVAAVSPANATNVDAVAVAATAAPADDLQNLLTGKGLLQQFGQQLVQKSSQVVQVGQVLTHSVVERTSDLVSMAMGLIGTPYRMGGNSVESGFDCSGFVRAIYKDTLGLILPRSADQQAHATQTIDKSELKPGDLVFFNTMKRTFSHVGIYLGEGKFIHAPRTGAFVRVEDMRIPYWNIRFDGARRVSTAAADSQKLQTLLSKDALTEATIR